MDRAFGLAHVFARSIVVEFGDHVLVTFEYVDCCLTLILCI